MRYVAALYCFARCYATLHASLGRALTLCGDCSFSSSLAPTESERLLKALKQDGVRVKAMIVNQIIADDSASGFVERVVRGQNVCLTDLQTCCDAKNIHVTQLPFFDTEVRGLPALRALGMVAFAESDSVRTK
jgi:anion-transporting  ArsA/GET3 family ATPase